MFVLPAATRYPGEGENAFAAFADYLAMGWDIRGDIPRRIARIGALDKVKRRVQPPTVVDTWFAQFDWEDRANSYDAGIIQGTSAAIRDVCVSAQVNLAAFTTFASGLLMQEFERSLDKMRGNKSIIDPTDLVVMLEKLTKASQILAPPNPEEGKRYNPDLGGYPEDQLIAEECARMDQLRGALAPGEPPIPGLTSGPESVE